MEIDERESSLTTAKYKNYCEHAISSSHKPDSSDIKEESIFFFMCILNLEFHFTKLYHSVNSKNIKKNKKEFSSEQ